MFRWTLNREKKLFDPPKFFYSLLHSIASMALYRRHEIILNLSHSAVDLESTFQANIGCRILSFSLSLFVKMKNKLFFLFCARLCGKMLEKMCDVKFPIGGESKRKVIFMLCCHFGRGQKRKAVQTFPTMFWMVEESFIEEKF